MKAAPLPQDQTRMLLGKYGHGSGQANRMPPPLRIVVALTAGGERELFDGGI